MLFIISIVLLLSVLIQIEEWFILRKSSLLIPIENYQSQFITNHVKVYKEIYKRKEDEKNNTLARSDSIDFFPWNDGVDYNELCWSIKRQYDQFDAPSIIHSGKNGGLGHKTGYLFHSLVYGLLVKRPVKFYLPESFWENTDSCLKYMKFTEEEFKHLDKQKCDYCVKRGKCRNTGKTTLIIEDRRLFRLSKTTARSINQLNLSMSFPNSDHLKKNLYRIIINPRKDIQEIIQQQLSLYPLSFTGIHLRTGGKLANFKERGYWVTSSELPRITSFIGKMILSKHLPRFVFLSTDSDYAEQYLRQKLSNINFLQRIPVGRTHSTKGSVDDAYRGALFDMIVSARASHFFYSPKSGFSETIQALTLSKETKLPSRNRFVLFNKQLLNCTLAENKN